MPLVHHELCFGCGRMNLFGVMLEVEPAAEARVSGRCFIKQDHQGAERASAHEGVIAAALSEAMALACGPTARARRLEVELTAAAPVGAFVELTARLEAREEGMGHANATATADQVPIARARGTFQL